MISGWPGIIKNIEKKIDLANKGKLSQQDFIQLKDETAKFMTHVNFFYEKLNEIGSKHI